MTKQPRIAPLPTSEWDAAAFDALGRSKEIAESNDSPVPNVVTTMAQHPALAKALWRFTKHVLVDSSLPERTRELLILRISWLREAEYEWAHHTESGRAAGLSNEEIAAVAEGPDAAVWGPSDAALVRAVDELHEHGRVGDQTWDTLSGALDDKQLMDLVFTVGTYDMIAMAFNSFGLELDPGFEGFGTLRPA